MNKTIDFTQAGGLYTYQDTLDFLQTSYSLSMDAIAAAVGDKVILSGVTKNGTQVSTGWISFNGEALPFIGGLIANYIVIEEVTGTEQFDDAQQRSVYKTRQLKFSNTLGAQTGFAYSDLKNFPFKSSSINTALTTVQTIFKCIINFEDSVILDGCSVSNVGSNTLQITAGMIMFAGEIMLSPAYNGVFPAYIDTSGIWSTDIPTSGLYVKFDPYTSQRYQDVMRRFNHQSGQIIFSRVQSDRFDTNTGIGKWEWLGFKLSEDMRGRVPVASWFGVNGDSTIYDGQYRTLGNKVGNYQHTLTKTELPATSLNVGIWTNSQDYDDGHAAQNNIGTNPNPSNPQGTVTQIKTEVMGNATPFDIRQPFTVVAAIERI